MNEIAAWLSEVPPRPLGLVLHIGAGGAQALQGYAEQPPQRAVLVEGDGDTAAALRQAARRCPWAEVVEQVVAAEAGPAVWHRFELPRFNGLHVPARLALHYPRLRELAARDVTTTAFASLPVLAEPAGAGATDVLVLDVPGQEEALLASVEPGRLRRFAWVLVRGCALDDEAEGATAARIAAALQPHACRPVRARGVADPAWPLLGFQLDEQRLRIGQLRAQVAALDAALARSRESEAHWRAESTGARGQLRQSQRDLEQFIAERDRLAEAAVKDKARLRAERDQQIERVESLSARSAALESQVEERDRRIAELDAQFARLGAEGREAALRRLQLQEELARAEGQLDMVKGLLLGEPGP